MIFIILAVIIITALASALNSIYNKINIDQKGKRERGILKSISVLAVSFLVFFIYSLSQELYHIEYLKLWERLAFYSRQSFMLAFINMIIYQPIFLILDNLKKKNIYKIIIAIILIIIIDFIIFIMNFSLTF